MSNSEYIKNLTDPKLLKSSVRDFKAASFLNQPQKIDIVSTEKPNLDLLNTVLTILTIFWVSL